MSLKPFFCFYGGKWRVAPHYPPPEHKTIIEPFAGSAGYSMRYPDSNVRLYDADPVIVGLWDFLIHASRRDILTLPLTVEHVDDIPGPQEAKWLVGFWLNKGGSAPGKTPSNWMKLALTGAMKHSGGSGASNWWGPEIRKRIASQLDSIRHWRVKQQTFDKVLDSPATWFVDPPYQDPRGRHYRYHDVDYRRLTKWCFTRRGLVIVCETEGATWLPFRFFRDAKASPGKQKAKHNHRSREVVYVQRNRQRASS